MTAVRIISATTLLMLVTGCQTRYVPPRSRVDVVYQPIYIEKEPACSLDDVNCCQWNRYIVDDGRPSGTGRVIVSLARCERMTPSSFYTK